MKKALLRVIELENQIEALTETNLLLHSQIEEFQNAKNHEENFKKIITRSASNSKSSKIVESSSSSDSDISEGSYLFKVIPTSMRGPICSK